MVVETDTDGRAPLSAALTASSYVEWGAVAAGLFVAWAISIVLFQFGATAGLAVGAPTLADGATSWNVLAAGLWVVLVTIASALALGAAVIGINNRDLATFRTDLATTLELLDEIPDEVIVVSESGIRSRADVDRLGEGGVDAILVGETLLKAPDPEHAARELATVSKRERVRG
jgi:hypothetical protein